MNGEAKGKNPLSPVKQAYLKLEELQSRLDAVEQAKREPIAIVGIACRFPGGSHDPEAFWRFLREGQDAVREIPADRWDIEAYYDPNPGTAGKMYTRSGAFLDRVDLFDPQFFGIAPREAIGMDPQQRLLLEVTWEALERSGLYPDKLSGSRTGVFVGLCTSDYAGLQLRSLDVTKLDAYHASGIAHSIASGRLSYVLGLQGPCVTLDTACSSSLVAVHLACQSLRGRECNLALAGGVGVILSPDMFIALSKASMLAPDGRCKTFDASADGYARGEGCGVVVLKRLSDARAEGDQILALVRGSAINQDGPSSGLTAPNGPSQTSVIRDALANGGVRPEEVTYVETHGTGTSLGDPIEVQALGAAYCESRPPDHPLLIGAVKSNIGHLEGAAGVAGLIKLVMAMQHGEIPPSLHVKKPNPFIPWEELSVKVTTRLTPWEPSGKTRMAGLSSFGFSGTNAHIVVEEAPTPELVRAEVERPRHLLALSAMSEEALAALAGRFHQHLSTHPDEGIENICYTANSGRAHWPHRMAIFADSSAQMCEKLGKLTSAALPAGVFKGQAKTSEGLKVAFLFTGQGSQYVGMGRELYETQPTFRRVLDQCSQILQDELDPPLLSVLYPEPGQSSPLDETAYTQPALFSLEYALAQLWRSWGILPAVVMGHSVGEYVAACVAGVFSLEDGLKLIAARGRLMQQKCESGLMAAVSGDEPRVAKELEGYGNHVAIAALNGPGNTVISGRRETVQELIKKFVEAGMKATPLTVSHAFHSPLMEPMLEAFEKVAAKVKHYPPRLALISNLTGQMVSPEEISKDYWVRQVREAVNFSASVQTVQDKGYQVFLELGPNPTLLGMASKCLPEGFGTWLPSLRKGREEWQQMLESLAALYVQGAEVDWRGFDGDYQRRRVVLPTYPFQRKRYWFEVPEGRAAGKKDGNIPRKTLGHPLLSHRLDSPFIKDVLIESYISSATLPWLKDHQAFGLAVFPATGYLEMILASAKEAFGPGIPTIKEMDIREAMIIEEGEVRRVQIAITPPEGPEASFQLASLIASESNAEAKWKVHAAGKIRIEEPEADSQAPALPSLEEARSRCQQEIPVEPYHQQFAALGMYLGPSFKGLERLWSGKNEVLGQVRLVPEIASEAPLYQIHPGMLDPCLQPFAAAALSPEDLASGGVIYMPVGVDSYRVYREPGEGLWSHVVAAQGKHQNEVKNTLHFDVFVFDCAGALVAEVRGLSLRRVDRKALAKSQEKPLQDWLYQLSWKEAPLPNEMGRTASVCIPSPPQIIEELRLYTNRHRSEPGLAEFASLFPRLETLSTHYVYRALSQLGWTIQKHERFTTESKATELQLPEKYFRLLGRMLEMLQQDGILKRVDGVWEVNQLPPALEPEMSADRLLEQYPDCSAELRMTVRCGEHLAEAMKGDCEPLDLLFPDGSMEDIEKLYRDSPFSRFYNGMIEEAVEALVTRLPSDRPLRVLEIGAGTGSTTASVLPKLPAQQTQYVCTDVTPLFTSKAREKFSNFPFVKYRVLDIEKDPLAQGFDAHSYDIVIAANVLHATQDLQQTLKNVQTLLASQGLLLLLEGTRPLRFGDLIVGLTEGWWRFKDTELRPFHALISDRKWQALLASCGFTDVVISPEVEPDGVLANQSLILARGPRPAGEETKPSTSAPEMSGRWMIFSDRSGLGESLCALLKPAAGSCCTVIPGSQYETLGEASYQINADNPDDFQELLRAAGGSNESPLKGVVYLWPLDTPNPEITSWEDLNGKIQWGCESLLHLVKALVSEGNSKADSLWIVTRGAQSVNSSAERVALSQAPVSAMGSTIGLEYPELRCARIDLDPAGAPGEADDLLQEVQSNEEETLLAFRQGRRHVARLSRVSDSPPADKSLAPGSLPAYQLQTSAPGMLDRLALQPLPRRHPGAGEVEVAVLATGLNFRDVLMALGRYPGGSDVFGYECAGKIAALGAGVRHFQLGQRVLVMGPGSFASHMTLPVDHVMPVPNSLSDYEAATIPSAFLTAHYALSNLGKIAAGDRVLIHAAAGGVGLAAVQLAQRAGAEVFATAGSPQKRAYLKSLGVAHVMDSRTLDFASEIMQLTQGKGVDLVLNSLAGEFIEKSFSVMATNGRFLEIGMTDIWDDARVSQLNKNISYYPINLAATFRESPRLIADMLHELLQEFEAGRLKPLPLKVFPVDQVIQAFRYMAQARHIGKIVVTHESPAMRLSQKSGALSGERHGLDGDASYLITGGLAGLGLLVAQWMVEQGARHLVVTGRSQPSEQALQVIRGLQETGAEVVIAQGDVSDRSHLDEVFSKFGRALPPLRGIVHSAGTLDDGVLLHQSWQRFQTVFAPKVSGSWQLHTMTQDLPLDFFVMFSSAVSLLGSAGQGNHVAACAFEDGLAHYRCALGLPALSINWGPWAEVGAATRGTVSQRLQLKGFQAIEPEQGLRVLEELLGHNRIQVGVLSADWRQYCDSLPRKFRSAFLSELVRKTEVPAPSGQRKTGQPQALLQQLNQVPPAKRQKLLLEFVGGQAVKILGLGSTQSLDYKQPLSDLGLDSLMAVELRSLLSTELGLARGLPATLVFDYPTIAALADYLAEEVLSAEKPPAAKSEAPQKEEKFSDILDRIEGLSEEEVDRLCTQEKAVK